MTVPNKKLSDDERNKVAQFLMQKMVDVKLSYGAQTEAALVFGITDRTVRKWWKATKEQIERGKPVHLQCKSKGKSHKDKMKIDVEAVKELTMLQRSSIRKMASTLGVSKSLLGNWIKEKKLKVHSSAIKPTLTEINKLARLRWCLHHLDPSLGSGDVKYELMHNVVHIDEKWFYLTKTSDRYYLLPDEIEPYRSCKSKRFISKVMFMCAVSRPLIGMDGSIIFDGKLGIFPFTTLEPAKRKSKNRAKGTLELKPINSITKEVIKDCIINKIIPAIKSKWPSNTTKHIIIQQDNAKPHITRNDTDFIVAANSDGFHINLLCQPPNSPDCNVNDLGFFRAIQSLQDDKQAKGVEDLVKNVKDAYNELSAVTLNNVFITLQGCYTEIMKVRGGNNYKIPHMNKAKHIRDGTLPECLTVDEVLIRQSLEFLSLPENNIGASYDIGSLETAFGI